MRVWAKRHRDLGSARTQVACRLHAVLCALVPGSGRGLDVGCGLGVEAGYLASAGWQVAGIGLSETAARRAAAEHGDVVFVLADVRRLPFAPDRFDAAVRHEGVSRVGPR